MAPWARTQATIAADDGREVGDPARPDRDRHLAAGLEGDAALGERAVGRRGDVVEHRLVEADAHPVEQDASSLIAASFHA